MSESKDPPEGTVGLDWRDLDLGPDGEKHVAELKAKLMPKIEFIKQLREVLGMSHAEFDEFLQKDEHEGLPADIPRPSLTFSKVQDFLMERGGKLSIIITLDDREITIPA